MKPEFQNSFTLNDVIYKEYYDRMTIYNWIFPIVFILVAGAALTALLLYTRLSVVDAALYAAFCAAILLLPFRTWFGYGDHWAKRHYNKLLQNKEDDLRRVVEFSDHITSFVPSMKTLNVYEYTDIKKVIESRQLYILLIKKRGAVLLHKGCFTVGDEQAFLTFVSSRRER